MPVGTAGYTRNDRTLEKQAGVVQLWASHYHRVSYKTITFCVSERGCKPSAFIKPWTTVNFNLGLRATRT